MSWVYEQVTGRLLQNGQRIAIGYAGIGDGKNNPDMQDVQGVGPLPKGVYEIGSPRDTPTHGPYVLPLTPDDANEMHGRSSFLIHGDSIRNPGFASHGCIVVGLTVREKVWLSGDRKLEVI